MAFKQFYLADRPILNLGGSRGFKNDFSFVLLSAFFSFKKKNLTGSYKLFKLYSLCNLLTNRIKYKKEVRLFGYKLL